MGESCEEGGPCPSHKIPQNAKTRSNAQDISLFICQKYSVTIKVQLAFSPKNSRVMMIPFSNVDILFIEETLITIVHAVYPFVKIRNPSLLQEVVTTD